MVCRRSVNVIHEKANRDDELPESNLQLGDQHVTANASPEKCIPSNRLIFKIATQISRMLEDFFFL